MKLKGAALGIMENYDATDDGRVRDYSAYPLRGKLLNDTHAGNLNAEQADDLREATLLGIKALSDLVNRADFATDFGTVFMSQDTYIEMMGLNWLPTRHRLIREMRKRNKNK